MVEFLKVGELYPVADGESVPAGWEPKTTRVRATAEKRPPRTGEWYLSGAIIEGYHAPYDMRDEHRIGELVKGEMVWREVKPDTDDREYSAVRVDCGQGWVAEIGSCPRCGLGASEHAPRP